MKRLEKTYDEAKKMVCKHLRSLLNLLEKMKIRCNDGWCDWIECPNCRCMINLTDYYDPEDFGRIYPIDTIR